MFDCTRLTGDRYTGRTLDGVLQRTHFGVKMEQLMKTLLTLSLLITSGPVLAGARVAELEGR